MHPDWKAMSIKSPHQPSRSLSKQQTLSCLFSIRSIGTIGYHVLFELIGSVMNAHGISLSVVAVLLLAALLMKEPSALAATGAEDPNGALVARIEALEKALKSQQESRELTLLKSRVDLLERSIRENRQKSVNAAAMAQPSDFSRLKSENATLNRTVKALESKISSVERSCSPLKREIGKLRVSISSLEAAVGRLQSRR